MNDSDGPARGAGGTREALTLVFVCIFCSHHKMNLHDFVLLLATILAFDVVSTSIKAEDFGKTHSGLNDSHAKFFTSRSNQPTSIFFHVTISTLSFLNLSRTRCPLGRLKNRFARCKLSQKLSTSWGHARPASDRLMPGTCCGDVSCKSYWRAPHARQGIKREGVHMTNLVFYSTKRTTCKINDDISRTARDFWPQQPESPRFFNVVLSCMHVYVNMYICTRVYLY